MAKDVEPKVYGRVSRLDGTDAGGGMAPFVPYTGPMTNGGTSYRVRPPETGSKWQDAWSRNWIVIAFRSKWISQLWITDFWWRSAILAALIVALITLFIIG